MSDTKDLQLINRVVMVFSIVCDQCGNVGEETDLGDQVDASIKFFENGWRKNEDTDQLCLCRKCISKEIV